MRHTLFIAALALLLTAALAAPVRAQYMYLDSNGDGVHSSADMMNPSGVPTTVRVFLSTNQNRDGSPAECSTFDGPLMMSGYSFNLRASSPVQYAGFVNHQPSFPVPIASEHTDLLHYWNGFAGGVALPAGTYHLATLTIIGLSGSTTVDIVDYGPIGQYTTFHTAFGCSGNDFDSIQKLAGLFVTPGDWSDADGLGASTGGGGGGEPPVLDPIADQIVDEETQLAVTATASDPEGDPLFFTLYGSIPPGDASITPAGYLTWTPMESLGPGVFELGVRATDGVGEDIETFSVTVNEVNQSPTFVPIDDQTTPEGLAFTVTFSAMDNDYPFNPTTYSLVSGPPGGSVVSTETSGGWFNWQPGEADGPGIHPVTVMVEDGHLGSFDQETFTITVTEANQAPVLTTIPDQTVVEGATVSLTVTATDGDLPAQTLEFGLFGAPLGATINPSTGEFTWTATVPGSYPVNVVATDHAGGIDFDEFTILVSDVNEPPVLNVIGDRTVDEMIPLEFTAAASDMDLPVQTLTFSLAPGAPAGASISLSGSFTWTPTEAQGPGIHAITVEVSDGTLTDSETIQVAVNEVNRAPILNIVSNSTRNESGLLSDLFSGTATDFDVPAQTLTWSVVSGAPAGFTLNPATGRYTWLIQESQGPGVYPITVQVSDGSLQATGTFTITVLELNTPPLVADIDDLGTNELQTVALTASAADFDIPANTLSFSLAPHGTSAAITPEGAFSWTPVEADNGEYSFTVIATDNGTPALQGTESFSVFVNEVNTPPVLNPVVDMTVAEGGVATQQLTATDADLPAQNLYFFRQTGPLFMTVTIEGLITLSPSPADAGTYTANVIASDASGFSGQDFQIVVTNVNNPPTADANGPYNGSTNTPVAFDGTASSDPDGEALTYAWDFGDATSGAGATPSHQYTAAGTFNVTLTVSDGIDSDQDATTATIVVEEFDALVFFDRDNRLKLNAGKPSYCVQVQPDLNSFTLTNVDLATIAMISEGTGSVSRISSLSGKATILDGDMNNDGIQEIKACFGRNDLRNLFSNLGGGTHTVTVAVEGNLYTGGKFHGEVVAVVSGISGGALAASISPNPLNPKATLTLSLAKAGAVKVQLFDVQGRLMRNLMEGAAQPGYVDVEIDGTDAAGRKLASGIYYVSIVTEEGRMTKPITILK